VTAYVRTPLNDWIKSKIGLPVHRELTRKALFAYQLERLRIILDYVMCCSPFYRHHFADHMVESLQSLSDLAEWPLTTTDDLRKDPLAFLCISQSAVERVVTLPSRSSHTSPMRLFFSAADLELAVDFFHHGFSTAIAPGQRMLVLMPCRFPYSVGDLLSRGLSRLSVQAITHGPMQSPQATVEAILQNCIDCLVGVPSEMEALSQYPGRKSIPSGQIKNIWLGTQNHLQCVADDIGQAWDCRVFQHYGTAEMCPGGGVQCRVRDGFHLREADLLIEIVNPDTAKPLADGAYGEVVVTTLTRKAMPLVRYRTGHRAAVMTASCPCGTVLRRLDILPKKFFDKPLGKGKLEGAMLNRKKFEQMKDEYYDQRGWDPKSNIPTWEKLMKLGLEEKF
jgi:phenylacetate-coenzyme A ligase PaaK-like adenylate-forming protein